MKKPSGYEEANENTGYTPVDLGGHYCVIKQVKETQSKTGKDMIIVAFDFDKKDSQPGYFSDAYEKDDRDGKKWPYAGTMYIMVNDYMDPKKTSSSFKGFCTSCEKSNNFEIAWTENGWSKQFTGKKIGCVFGEVESEYDGKTSMRVNPRWFCKYDEVEKQTAPKPKYLSGNAPRAAAGVANNDFMNVESGDNDEIPFL